ARRPDAPGITSVRYRKQTRYANYSPASSAAEAEETCLHHRSIGLPSIKPVFLPLLALAPAFFNNCFAQSVTTPKWSLTTITRVKPDMRQEFESCLRQLTAAYRKGGVPWFATFETFAGDTTEYTTILPVMNFGDLDAPAIAARLFGDTGWQRLSRKLARCY